MNILMLHNRYKIRGGEDESTDAEVRLLRARGHTVDLIERHNDELDSMNPLAAAVDTIWSRRAYAEVQTTLRRKRYNVLHVQNFFPLFSPSVYAAARAEGVPVVQALRNYRLICPAATLFRDGKICRDCVGRTVPWPAVQHACYRGSRAGTAAVAGMVATHRLLGTWSRAVNTYVALTDTMRTELVAGGLPPERIIVKPNFVEGPSERPQGPRTYALYVGRLSPEKGLDVLLSAWQRLKPQMSLKIVGEGPLAATSAIDGVEWLGRRSLAETHALMAGAAVLVMPAVWMEPFGRVVVEAFAHGTPVIAADRGGVAELVQDGVTGRHFRAGDADDLARVLSEMLEAPDRLSAMGMAARQDYEARFTPDRNYDMLRDIYVRAMGQQT